MALISSILPQKRNPDRVNLYLDGEFFCGLDAFTAGKFRLKEGVMCGAEELAQIVFEDECASAFEKAMRQVNVRMRSEHEIRAYLKDKQYAGYVIDAAIEKLINYRYIDDAEFCRLYADVHRKRWGSVKIKYALKNLGIESETIDEILSDMPDQVEEAFLLAEKYCRGKEFDSRKVYAHLMQKGFDSDTIKSAIERLKDENE
ncbi:MAG: RecX family transcriptional regulator [Firmicutes bacterium]|nr:RecX family transcriptional regulator [Bacillota bacterium]